VIAQCSVVVTRTMDAPKRSQSEFQNDVGTDVVVSISYVFQLVYATRKGLLQPKMSLVSYGQSTDLTWTDHGYSYLPKMKIQMVSRLLGVCTPYLVRVPADSV
jgi:hypothetical protein